MHICFNGIAEAVVYKKHLSIFVSIFVLSFRFTF
jgi:hypothetical protein